MKSKRVSFASIFMVVLFLISGLAVAGSDTHYQDILVGERAAGMGGAFTALSNEATGAYYNPAGIISDASTLIQASMSAFSLRQKHVAVLDFCGTRLEEDESSLFTLPVSFGFVKLFNKGNVKHGLGLTLVMPHAEKVGQSFDKQNARCGPISVGLGGSRLTVDRVFWSGLTYAIRPWPFLQAGVTVGLGIRAGTVTSLLAMTFDVNDSSAGNTGTTYPAIGFTNLDMSLWNLFLQFGLIIHPGDKLHIGLSVTTPYFPIADTGRLDILSSQPNPVDWQQSGGVVLDDAEFSWKVPLKLAFGLAYRVSSRLTMASDLKLHLPVERYPLASHTVLDEAKVLGFVEKDFAENQRNWVLNANIGGEFHLTSQWLLRFGAFTNFTSLPEDTLNSDFEHIHLFGATLGGTFISNQLSTLSAVVQGQIGQGEAQGYRISADRGVESFSVDVEDFSLLISVGGSFDIR